MPGKSSSENSRKKRKKVRSWSPEPEIVLKEVDGQLVPVKVYPPLTQEKQDELEENRRLTAKRSRLGYPPDQIDIDLLRRIYNKDKRLLNQKTEEEKDD